jgi:hypothetical protein
MLVAAVSHAMYGIPTGDLKEEEMPERTDDVLSDVFLIKKNLEYLNYILELENPTEAWSAFWRNSKSSTQRIASRRVRFPIFYRALLPQEL